MGINQKLQMSVFITKPLLDLEHKNQQIKTQLYHGMTLILKLSGVLVDFHEQGWM